MKTENFSPRQALNKALFEIRQIPLIRGLWQLSRIYSSPLKVLSRILGNSASNSWMAFF